MFTPEKCVTIYQPQKSPVDFKYKPGTIRVSDTGMQGLTPEQARALAAAIIKAALEVEAMNKAKGV